MGKNASGMYVIDADYNIVSYNHAAEIIYPELKKGEKCYRCLLHNEEPCESCPVVNGIEGPKNYLEPRRNVLRSIDAVEIPLESGEMEHAMIFSAAEATEEAYRGITNNGENPLLLGIINVLGKDYSNIYSLDCATHKIQICRFHNHVLGRVSESLICEEPYEKVMDIYIEDNVASEDQTRMRQMMDFDKICQRLKKVSQFMIHYRVRRDGITHYYYVKCARIGKAEDFEAIVLAFANEDMDIQHSEMESILEPGGPSSRRKLLIIEDNELNRKLLAELLEDSYEVMTAVNGEEGLKLLGENYRDISAILLDVSMPICDGFQFLDRIRDDVMLSSVPVIVITGSNRPEDEVRCLELGAVDFIRKPYNVRIVKGKINSVIKLRESAIVLSALEYDELTGLYIRQAFFHHAKTLMRVKKDQKFHVVVADVKNFKWINSTYGEKTGDQFVAIVYGGLNFGKDKVEAAICKIAERAPISNLSVNYGIYENVDKTLPLTLICDRAFLAMKSIQDDYEHSFAFYDEEMGRKHIRGRMMENGIPFSAVPIELTETAALYNVQIKELTEKMVNVGFELHMDDFGSGYSSMTSLNQLPFDTLELDCDEIQGFYYSRPVPLGEFCTDFMGE